MDQKQQLDRIRKITVKTVCGKVDFEEIMKAKKLDLMSVYGVIRLLQAGASDLGNYVAFVGDFRAVNVRTGEVFASAKMILPKIAEESLAGAHGGTPGTEVKFALMIGATYDKEAATKYVYHFRPLVEATDSDAIAELGAVVQKALPKPTGK